MRHSEEVVIRRSSVKLAYSWPAMERLPLPVRLSMLMAVTKSWGCDGRSEMDYFRELTDLLGASVVSIDPQKLQEQSGDKWFASHLPDVVAEPQRSEQVAVLLEFANRKQIPVTPRGSGY